MKQQSIKRKINFTFLLNSNHCVTSICWLPPFSASIVVALVQAPMIIALLIAPLEATSIIINLHNRRNSSREIRARPISTSLLTTYITKVGESGSNKTLWSNFIFWPIKSPRIHFITRTWRSTWPSQMNTHFLHSFKQVSWSLCIQRTSTNTRTSSLGSRT